jgi:hypothetical protein
VHRPPPGTTLPPRPWRAHPPRDRRPAADCPGTLQRRNRRSPGSRRDRRPHPRDPDPGQARSPRPRPSRRGRLRNRTRTTRHQLTLRPMSLGPGRSASSAKTTKPLGRPPHLHELPSDTLSPLPNHGGIDVPPGDQDAAAMVEGWVGVTPSAAIPSCGKVRPGLPGLADRLAGHYRTSRGTTPEDLVQAPRPG